MNKFEKIISMSIGIILFSGCANPSFNPNNKKIVFVEGKPFRVPVGAGHTKHRYTSLSNDKEKTNVYNKYDMNCNLGDILWIEKYTAIEGAKIYKAQGKIAAYNYASQASRQGKAGCVRPISDQEYSFYRSKEMEASANARTRANLAAAMIPKRVNVNHSGTVYQNVNVTGTMDHTVKYKPYYGY